MPLEIVPINLMEGDHMKSEFMKMNPNGKIPVFQDGDFFLWESQAIMHYLAVKSGNKTMWPDDVKAQAEILKWMCWNMAHFSPACGTVLFEKFVKAMKGEQPDMNKVKEGMELFHRYASVLNEHLASRKFVMGDQPGMPDFALSAPLIYAEAVGLPMGEFPHMQAWFGRVMAMPEVKQAIPPMPAHA
jgi:glutathione S-transferase